jgi:hypothetical protein
MSRGLKNYNPGNIRKGGDTFQGEKLPSTDSAFKQFKTMAYGYRAMFVLLATYITDGHNTITKIISRWAPDNENDTAAYIKAVSKASKIKPDVVLTVHSVKEVKLIVAAMSGVENGAVADNNAVEAGFKLQFRIHQDK